MLSGEDEFQKSLQKVYENIFINKNKCILNITH